MTFWNGRLVHSDVSVVRVTIDGTNKIIVFVKSLETYGMCKLRGKAYGGHGRFVRY